MTHVYKRTLVVDGITPVSAYAFLRKRAEGGSFLLESVIPGERWGRYSILGYRPKRQVLVYAEPGRDPFEELARQIPTGKISPEDVAERFATAFVGVVDYDVVHTATKVEPWPSEGPRAPVARLVGGATNIVFDNLTHTATLIAEDPAELDRAERDLAQVPPLAPMAPPDPTALPSDIDVTMSDAEFEAGVDRIKEYIRAGDAFQVVYARTFSTPAGNADPFDVYRSLCVLSPAPYMYLLEFPEQDGAPRIAIAGASPETLVRVEGRKMTLRPIAGTRRRGRTPDEDTALAEEMLADPKERAEHVMLIDLARNDIGRVAKAGTVTMPMQMQVERYSHVMHIVSEVTGEVAPEKGAWDVLRAAFPAGTLSGAPKVRAMQIIRELEKRPRGAYGGAIGYVTEGMDLDFAIAIRTVVMKEGRFEVTAGAGIVADSVPALECKETRNKARAALASIHAARERLR
ncbi:MAG: anthranilate synthase component I family protein [Polyangiaceae bacterium]